MKLLNKSEASRHLGISRQHMNYHTKKKGGEFPSFVHNEGELIDVDNEMLLVIVSKILNVAHKKEARGVPPGYIDKDKTTKKASKKAVKKKVSKKIVKKSVKTVKAEEEKEQPRTQDRPIGKKPMADLVEESERAKCEQEIHKAAKLSNDLEVSRGKLISRELVADVMVAYLDSLSKEIMQMPVSVIQEISAGIEAGKSNIELVNDLRKHLSTAIANTKKTSINTMKRLMK